MNSGFGQVTKYLALGLRKLGHEISMTGMQNAYTSGWYYGIENMPLDTKFVDELTQFMMNINITNPDVVIGVFQADADMNHFTRIFSKDTKSKFIWYPSVEGKDIPDGMANDLRNVINNGGKVVGQCKYGQDEMRKVGVDASMIYHGYNPDIFYPMDIKNEKYEPYCYYGTSVGQEESDPRLIYKQGCYNCPYDKIGKTGSVEAYGVKNSCPYLKEEIVNVLRTIDGKWTDKEIGISKLSNETKGKFVYGSVGINFGIRKRIERLIKAYSIMISESKQMKDRTILHLHCTPIAINGVNLLKVITNLGISDNVIFSYGMNRSNAWTEEAICRLYNTFDCHVSASSSEGFGIPFLESMACGKANIAPNCSSMTELIGDGERENGARGLLAIIGEWQAIDDGSERALVNENHLAVLMKKLYVDKELRERFSKNAIEFAKQYTWEKIVNEWDLLLKGMKGE